MNTQRKQNIAAVAIAGMLAVGLFVIVWSSVPDMMTSLQANIVWVKQDPVAGEFIQQSYGESVGIEANIAMTDLTSITMFVLYDPEEVSPNFDAIRSIADVTYSEEVLGRAVLFLTNILDISIWDELLRIPVNDDVTKLIISDINILFDDGEKSGVSITVQ